ncbi:DUF2846 domain-containing protein [Metapseudomonas lalkuanensis]|uniref:DUF2846 domain-containing protein n=1 Tax=Metapseudomonas lalkuanensis TaxID=2604832 RepID=A0A5J6QV43_9GAMM|nr:DUF2846 domain-containing protein [Pseudomonas lalkuanensis]QEY64706.1 DUF2846 domain-containing protein [Pseudomonas lalkuanensis]UCO97258.1 DUF2846 domain-containing protein [Pseudomonas lalkuanensis]
MGRRHLLILLLCSVLGGCSTPGAFFGATEGPEFQPSAPSDGEHALVYLYRPQSEWADQELEAPGIFLNNELIGSLPSNGHLALEFDAASYKLEMRRPLFGSYWTLLADGPLDFTLISSFALEASAGRTYYLRYDELDPPPKNSEQQGAGNGPLQLVAESLGSQEIAATRQVQPSQRVAANGEVVRPQVGFWRGVGRALDKIGI